MWICVFVSFNFFRFFFPFERTKINLFSSMGVCMASEKYHPIKTEIKLTIRKILPGAQVFWDVAWHQRNIHPIKM